MKKFPLVPLVELRTQAVEARRETLLEADLQLQKAQQAHAHAERLERQHDAERRAVEEQEALRLAAGELRAGDLGLLTDYEIGARAVALRLHQHNLAQAQKMQRAEHEQREASQALAEARAEARVIERRLQRFVQAERVKLDAKAEEDVLETWQSRKVRC